MCAAMGESAPLILISIFPSSACSQERRSIPVRRHDLEMMHLTFILHLDDGELLSRARGLSEERRKYSFVNPGRYGP
jgi:hypothetical protein